MSITVGEVKTGVLHEMREFSNSGAIQGEADIKDYLLSIIPLLNVYLKELATTTHKLSRKFKISHNMPDNQLGKIVWNEEKVHTGGTDDEYIATGSKAYSLQVSRYATVYIKEETTAGVWETRVTINHTPTAEEGYVTYKGLTGIVTSTNRVKIVFSGDYRYPYRWVALFSDNFYNASEVPQFEPYVPYVLPANWFAKDRIEYTHSDRQFGDYAAFKFDNSTAEKTIYLNWYEKAEFICRYFAYPAVIATPSPTNLTALDSTVLDIADECLPSLIYRIAGTLLRDENPYMADTLSVEYQVAKAELVQNNSYESGESGIILNANW